MCWVGSFCLFVVFLFVFSCFSHVSTVFVELLESDCAGRPRKKGRKGKEKRENGASQSEIVNVVVVKCPHGSVVWRPSL